MNKRENNNARPDLLSHSFAHCCETPEAPRMRGLRQDRRRVGSLADVPGMRRDTLSRRLTHQARLEACPHEQIDWAPL